jgi:hypothetical protein
MGSKVRQLLLGAAAIAGIATLTGCGESDGGPSLQDAQTDPGPVHVHGLGENPADGSTVIATHTGIWRLPEGSKEPTRVANRFQDTMGFAVAGPDHFVGSGHPDMSEDLPPFLGFIDSRDAGETWDQVSLLGEADFHVLEISGNRVYGFGSDFKERRSQFLTSGDGGRTWTEFDVPEEIVSLAIDPTDPETLVASGETRLFISSNNGRNWSPVPGPPGLLVWRQNLHLINRRGMVFVAPKPGGTFKRVGRIGGEPAAFDAGDNELLVALHDGTIKESSTGRSWTARYAP